MDYVFGLRLNINLNNSIALKIGIYFKLKTIYNKAQIINL